MLQSLKKEGIKEIQEWSNLIVQDISPLISSNYEVLMFFRNDLFNIINKIKNLFNESLTSKEKENLLKILFNISESFQFFHGFLSILEIIEDQKFNFFLPINYSAMFNHRFSITSIEYYEKCKLSVNYEKESKMSLKFSTPSFACDKIYFYCYDENFGIAKFYFNSKLSINKLNLVKLNDNLKQSSSGSMFTIGNKIFLLLQNRFLEKKEAKNFLDIFHVFHNDNLCQIKDFTMNFDFNSSLFFNDLEKTHKFQQFKYKEVEYPEELERIKNGVLVTSDGQYVYIYSQMTKFKESDPYKNIYCSKTYIYTIDIFTFVQNTLKHIKTIHLKDDKNPKKEESSLFDEIYENKMISVHCGNLIGYASNFSVVVYNLINNQFVSETTIEKKTAIPIAIFNDLNNNLFIISDSAYKNSSNILDSNCISLEYFKFNKDLQYYPEFNGPESSIFDNLSFVLSMNDENDKNFSEKIEEKNIFNNIFNLNFDKDPYSLTSQSTEETVKDLKFDLYILSNFSLCASYKCSKREEQALDSNDILGFLKIPYVLNLEYPTIKTMIKMIIKSWNDFLRENDEKNNNISNTNIGNETLLKSFFLIKILDYHLDQIRILNCDMKLIFREDKEIEELVENILKIILFNMSEVNLL